MSDTDVLESTPIFDEVLAARGPDLDATGLRVTKVKPWEFDYFDGHDWDHLSTLETDTTIKVTWPHMLLVETQSMPILDPRTTGEVK